MAEEVEENYSDTIIKVPINAILENCKLKLFANDKEGFLAELSTGKFKMYNGTYKYSSDYNGKPFFIINNLLNGFVIQLQDRRKYLFTAFRCENVDGTYNITSHWITNCTLPMAELIPDKYDDFDWTELENNVDNYNKMVELFMTKSCEGLTYLH